MSDDRCRLGSDDVVIGLDLASAEHQAVVVTAAGKRLTRFRIPHTRGIMFSLERGSGLVWSVTVDSPLCIATSADRLLSHTVTS